MKKVQGSLYFTLILMTWIPLVGFAVVILGFATRTLKTGMEDEVEEALRNLGVSIMETYETAYPGDYSVDKEGHVLKGSFTLHEDYSLIDRIKEETGVEVSLSMEIPRMLTTIRNSDNERIGGTVVSGVVAEHVLGRGEEFFPRSCPFMKKNITAIICPL